MHAGGEDFHVQNFAAINADGNAYVGTPTSVRGFYAENCGGFGYAVEGFNPVAAGVVTKQCGKPGINIESAENAVVHGFFSKNDGDSSHGITISETYGAKLSNGRIIQDDADAQRCVRVETGRGPNSNPVIENVMCIGDGSNVGVELRAGNNLLIEKATVRNCNFRNLGIGINISMGGGGQVNKPMARSNTYETVSTKIGGNSDNAQRVIRNGIGNNQNTDPASGGYWNGIGEDGDAVYWNDGSPHLSFYYNGAWRQVM
jgi:hypothetical protein